MDDLPAPLLPRPRRAVRDAARSPTSWTAPTIIATYEQLTGHTRARTSSGSRCSPRCGSRSCRSARAPAASPTARWRSPTIPTTSSCSAACWNRCSPAPTGTGLRRHRGHRAGRAHGHRSRRSPERRLPLDALAVAARRSARDARTGGARTALRASRVRAQRGRLRGLRRRSSGARPDRHADRFARRLRPARHGRRRRRGARRHRTHAAEHPDCRCSRSVTAGDRSSCTGTCSGTATTSRARCSRGRPTSRPAPRQSAASTTRSNPRALRTTGCRATTPRSTRTSPIRCAASSRYRCGRRPRSTATRPTRPRPATTRRSRALPVFVFNGAADPIGGTVGGRALADHLLALGLDDVTFRSYPEPATSCSTRSTGTRSWPTSSPGSTPTDA